ncbi:MAG: hypothetical protein JRE16_06015 [Deltaproteobacteria bacterium]|jgi:hypothetical protein|nr:hypothetical protein [Deltaproteobacteria bacterium]
MSETTSKSGLSFSPVPIRGLLIKAHEFGTLFGYQRPMLCNGGYTQNMLSSLNHNMSLKHPGLHPGFAIGGLEYLGEQLARQP